MLVFLQYVVLLPFVFVFFSSRTGENMCAYSRNLKKGDDEDDDDGDAGANNDNWECYLGGGNYQVCRFKDK